MNQEILSNSLFDSQGDIGVEEEFYVVDSDSFSPIEKPTEFLKNLPKELKNNLDRELFDFVVETWIDKSKNLNEAFEEVKNKRNALKNHAKNYDYDILGAGLHPCANWKVYNHCEKPCYASQLERIQYPQQRNLTAGLHVHIGMDNEKKAIWLMNETRKYIPLFLALSSNSPFWQGRDTGLQSTRALIFESLPNTGIPPYFKDMDEYRELLQKYLKNDFIKEINEIWWDVRINNKYGTLEIRAPDSQNEIKKTKEIIKLIYGVISHLIKEYNNDKPNSEIKKEILVQNKWQAIRHGTEAKFIFRDKTTNVKKLIQEIIKSTELVKEDISHLLKETGSNKQRRAYREGGMVDLLKSIRI